MNACEIWTIIGNDSQHRYPVISPKTVHSFMADARESPFELWALCGAFGDLLLDMNTVIASYKWQIKTLKAENEALRKALKQLQ